jgi:NADH-quinone oxidoreductase E subunit
MSRRLHPSVAGAQPFQLADRDPDAPLFETEEDLDRVEAILSRYPTKRAALLPLLSFAHELHGWISTDDMEKIAGVLELTPAYVWSVASFYTMYNKRPCGRHLIQVCTNISCFLNGATDVLESFLEHTGTREGETTEDGLFTVIEAECLGACGFATAVQINDEYQENVTPGKVPQILAELGKDTGS